MIYVQEKEGRGRDTETDGDREEQREGVLLEDYAGEVGRAQLGGCCRFGSWLILHQSCGSLWGTLEERASCLVH